MGKIMWKQEDQALATIHAQLLYSEIIEALANEVGEESVVSGMLAERTAYIYANIRDKETSGGWQGQEKSHKDNNVLWLTMHTALSRHLETSTFLKRARAEIAADIGAKLQATLDELNPEVAENLAKLFADALSGV